MDDVNGARAVVTGGASGIGRGLAIALAERGAAAVVLADVEESALQRTAAELAEAFPATRVLGAPTDVADAASVEALAARVADELGGTDVLCCNAGVFAGGYSWETTLDDWEWVLGTNVRGVVHGIRSFVPSMIEVGTPAHVIVTASVAGVVAAPVSAPYVTSKFAALGLAESLSHDLRLKGADHVAVSALCPAMVSTDIGDCDRNRPAHLPDATDTEGSAMARIGIDDAMIRGLDPVEGARHALGQALDGRFYVSTHPVELWERLVGAQNEDRLAGREPRFQLYE